MDMGMGIRSDQMQVDITVTFFLANKYLKGVTNTKIFRLNMNRLKKYNNIF